MVKKIFTDLVSILGNYPFIIFMGTAVLYAILEFLEGKPLLKEISSNSIYQFMKSSFFSVIIISIIGAFVYQAIFVEIGKFKNAAKTLGLKYHLKNHPQADALLYSPSLRRGERRDIVSPILSGHYKEADVLLFNYRYGQTESAGESYSFYFRSVVAFSAKRLQIPEFTLYPKQSRDQLIETLFGSGDIKFKEDPEFSRQYKLSGPDTHLIQDFFGPKLRKTFIQFQTKWAAGGTDDIFLLFKDGKTDDRIDSTDFSTYLNDAYQIFQTVLYTDSTHTPR